MKHTYAIDYDNTLRGSDGEPLPDAVRAMQALYREGETVIIFTARPEIMHAEIDEWLRTHKMPFKRVTNVKPQADIYIDDRAVRYTGNWNETIALCRNYLTSHAS